MSIGPLLLLLLPLAAASCLLMTRLDLLDLPELVLALLLLGAAAGVLGWSLAALLLLRLCAAATAVRGSFLSPPSCFGGFCCLQRLQSALWPFHAETCACAAAALSAAATVKPTASSCQAMQLTQLSYLMNTDIEFLHRGHYLRGKRQQDRGLECCSLLLLAWHSCEQYHACWQALHRFSLSTLPHVSQFSGGSLHPLSMVAEGTETPSRNVELPHRFRAPKTRVGPSDFAL
jgi:hypothetical protein